MASQRARLTELLHTCTPSLPHIPPHNCTLLVEHLSRCADCRFSAYRQRHSYSLGLIFRCVKTDHWCPSIRCADSRKGNEGRSLSAAKRRETRRGGCSTCTRNSFQSCTFSAASCTTVSPAVDDTCKLPATHFHTAAYVHDYSQQQQHKEAPQKRCAGQGGVRTWRGVMSWK